MTTFLSDIILSTANDIQFQTTAGTNAGKISQVGDDLVLSNAVGDILLGNGSDDIFIGDGTNTVDIRFEQNMAIFADSSSTRTLTLGGNNTNLVLENPSISGTMALGATTINNNLTFTGGSGFILFDYEPQTGNNAEYSNEVPLLKVDRSGTPLTIFSRMSVNGALAIGRDDTVAITAGDTFSMIKDNLNYTSEQVVFSSENGFYSFGWPNNMQSPYNTWSARNEFRWRTDSTTAANNGLYIGVGGSTQFIDTSRNLKNIGTISSGAISSGDITISDTSPTLKLTDTDHNDDWSIANNNGDFRIYNETDGLAYLIADEDNVSINIGDGVNVTYDSISGGNVQSGVQTTGNSGTVVRGGFLNPASEANMVHIPHIINDLAGFNKWSNGTIVTSGFYGTRSGSSGSYSYSNEIASNNAGWANAFDAHSSHAGSWYSDNGTDGVYTHGVDTPGTVELQWPTEITYSLVVGIVFGSGSFTATYVKIEAYKGDDNGNFAWQQLCEITDNTDQVILRKVDGNSGAGDATKRLKFTLGGSVNGSYFRIHSLYMANYQAGNNNLNNTGIDTTRGVNFLEKYKDGYLHGSLYPGADDTHDLGSNSYKWKNSYFDGIVYSDRVHSQGNFPQYNIVDEPNGGGSSRTMQLGMSGTSLYFKKSDATGNVFFRNTNNTDLMTIGLADSGKVTVLNELEAGSLDVNGASDFNSGTENIIATFTSTDSIGEIRIADNSKYTRLLTVGDTFKIMPSDGDEVLNISDSAVTVGVDDSGVDVILYGATSGKKMQWDQSADTLIVDGTLDINGGANISGTIITGGGHYISSSASTGFYTPNTDLVITAANNSSATGGISFKTNNGGTATERMSISSAGVATFSGDVVLSAGSLSITADGSNATVMAESGSGDFEINTAGTMVLDSSGEIQVRDDGTTYGSILSSGNNLLIKSAINNADMNFLGVDNSSTITALSLDMSDAGAAYFNSWIYTSGGGIGRDAHNQIDFSTDNEITFKTDNTTALTINSSQNATFSGRFSGPNLLVTGGSVSNTNGVQLAYSSNYAVAQLNGVTGSFIDFSDSSTDYKGRIIYTNSNNKFKFYTNATQALEIDSSQNATFAGTIGSGAITSTGKITGTELEGTSLDINGDADISGALNMGGAITIPEYINHTGDGNTAFGFATDDTFRVIVGGTTRLDIATGINLTGNTTVAGNITLSSNSNVVAARKFVARDGNGVMLTADDASSGLTIADNGNATFSGQVVTGNLECSDLDIGGTATGDGSGLTELNGSNITSGTIPSARLDADTAHLSGTQTFTGAKTFTGTITLTGTGKITGIDTVANNLDAANKQYVDNKKQNFIIACSDETTDLTTGTAKTTFRMPYDFNLSEVRASVSTAPAGSTIIVDINENGTSILSTKLSIDAGEKTSTSAATAAVITDDSLGDDSEITIDIDQIGSSTAGKGLKVTLIGTLA